MRLNTKTITTSEHLLENECDWQTAIAKLRKCESIYRQAGESGRLGLTAVVNPLVFRIEAGERTPELHEEIMDLDP